MQGRDVVTWFRRCCGTRSSGGTGARRRSRWSATRCARRGPRSAPGWCASRVAWFGGQVSAVAVPLTAVLVLHAGPVGMGSLTALQWLPSLLFGLHAGAWVDRRGKRTTMIVADLGRAVALATIPVCYALHV